MTNKKLKMAAMSVALTACVAASPLAANADAPEAAPVELEKEPVAEETKKEENTAEPQVNQEAKNAQKTLKDAEVKYDKDNPTTNPDGFQKLDGVIVTNPEGSGETDPNPNPNPNPGSGETGSETGSETGGETNPNPGSGETDPDPDPNPNPDSGETNPNPNPDSGETNPNPNPDSGETDPNPNPGSGETDTKEKKPEEVVIGTAEKTEKSETNVETKPNPGAEPIVDTTTPPTVEKNPDGSTTITQPTVTPGTETTTTTGTGEAKGDLHEKKEEVKKEDINLDKELGKKPDISWNIEKGADAVNGYKVEDVTNSEDGNKQTLKLRKEEETTAEMTAEDIAKLVDAEKPTVNPDGTYTLTRTETILDAEGNPQTRTTYITIRDNKVTTKTTTELTITRQKAKLYGDAEIEDKVEYPSITVTNQAKPEDTQTITPDQLKEMLDKGEKKDDGIHYTKDGKEYVIQVGPEIEGEPLSNAEIVAKLNNARYTLGKDDGEIYYTTDYGEKVKLEKVQKEHLRWSLTYKVTLTTTEKGDPGTAGEQTATENARRDATRDALTKAVDKLGVDEATAAQLKAKISGLPITKEQLDNGDTFEVTLEDGKKYTLTYSAAEAKVTASTPTTDKSDTGKKPEDITDVKDNTVTGKAYVTAGTISWTAENQKGEYTLTTGDASEFTPPPDAVPEYKDGKLTGYTVTSEDADGNTVTTTYTPTYGDASGMTENERKELAMQALMGKTGKTQAELEAAGYTNIRLENASIVTWTVTKTTQKKTDKTEQLGEMLTYTGDENWTIAEDGSTLTYGDDVYKMKDGKFTRTAIEDGKTVTYTATEQKEDVLSPDDAKAMLAKRFEVEISAIELNGTTATFTKNGAPVTVDCANLKKRTLTIERSEATSVQKTVVATDAATLQKAYDDLWAEIVAKKNKLGKDKTLFVGDIEITDTDETVKTQVIEYIKQHVTQADMTPEQLKAALKAQAEAAKTHMVKVNEGTEYEDTLPNYYAGDKADIYYKTEDGQRLEWYQVEKDKNGYYYLQWNGGFDWEKVYVEKVEVKPTNIKHLDLASGAQLEKQDGTSTDCVLVNPTLKWNYEADKLVDNDPSNTDVGLDSKISFDNEGGKGPGHYEYERGENNNPNQSAFYKVTGTVVYDAVKENGKVKLFGSSNAAFNAYLEETGQTETYRNLGWREKKAFREKIKQTYIVEIGSSDSNPNSPSGYQVYTQSADMTAYGYMTRDANTCINRTYKRQDGTWEYVGGYDLMISKLVQTKEGKVVGETESKVKNIFAPLSIRTSKNHYLRSMELTKKTTETLTEVPSELPGGSQETVKYLYDKSESVTPITEETKVEGTGEGHYKSFTNLIRNIFKGEDTGTVEGGSIEYKYHSEKDKEGNPVKFEAKEMIVTTKQDAEVHYTFTSQESRDVWIKGYTQTVVPPVNPGPDTPELPPVEDAKPAPAPAPAPEAPVLPVVQDARPDPAPAPAPAPAPETPVLPAVQDAKLIQTGTSGWLADLMLGAGMVLSAAGYWMERKRKAMFYKSQH
ncbi:hypothetical protein [Faecalibacterium prausnitzii]|uniref:Uncharacterized protein n=1 Tax=Faecalibacterium prausnitzii TaxID=853 RepID=A0A291TAI3_9FIRM|nr:hypothetical protein [Faecalibacterium prausnitzii]ATL90105.1 hypothetical protein CRH10_07235 [Faecalibacterium prausnitzii]